MWVLCSSFHHVKLPRRHQAYERSNAFLLRGDIRARSSSSRSARRRDCASAARVGSPPSSTICRTSSSGRSGVSSQDGVPTSAAWSLRWPNRWTNCSKEALQAAACGWVRSAASSGTPVCSRNTGVSPASAAARLSRHSRRSVRWTVVSPDASSHETSSAGTPTATHRVRNDAVTASSRYMTSKCSRHACAKTALARPNRMPRVRRSSVSRIQPSRSRWAAPRAAASVVHSSRNRSG